MSSEHSSIEDCLSVLRQGLALLERIGDRLYNEDEWSPARRSSVGAHVRHCLDAFICFLNGVGARRIDYQSRQRDMRVEGDRSYALAHLRRVIERLQLLSATIEQAAVWVKLESVPASRRDDPSSWSQSSVRRELDYLQSHTIHHYALIALMLRLQGFEPDAAFGVAPSTLQHWQREKESLCAR